MEEDWTSNILQSNLVFLGREQASCQIVLSVTDFQPNIYQEVQFFFSPDSYGNIHLTLEILNHLWS